MIAALLWCGGCSGASGPRLAEAGGVVLYNGRPVEGATVLFSTEFGSPAIGHTDSDGTFAFNTQGKVGAIVGPGEISITAIRQSRELTEEENKYLAGDRLEALLASITTWTIPKKYGHPRTSGLTVTVAEDPKQNQFTFDLK